jgi:glutamyl-tRNA reductase
MDISVPVNVHPGVKNIEGISVAGIDEISKILQSTQFKRLSELPKAKAIIALHLEELNAWLEMQRYTPIIRELKAKLEHLGDHIHQNESPLSFRVNKTISKLAVNLRQKNEKGCVYIHAFKDFLQPGIIE